MSNGEYGEEIYASHFCDFDSYYHKRRNAVWLELAWEGASLLVPEPGERNDRQHTKN